MKKYSVSMLLAFAAMVVVMGGCSNEEEEGGGELAKYITIRSDIGSLSRTATDAAGVQSFANGDQISVYAWTGTAAAVNTAGLVVNNSINTLSVSAAGSVWAASPQMLWKDMSTAHYFLGVYPKKDITDFKADAYALDLTKTEEQNDLLVAVNVGTDNAGLTATATAVPLQFDHVLAKLIVNLTFRNQWDKMPTVESVTAANFKSKATVDYLAKRATATADAATDIKLPATTAGKSYQSVMVPQPGEAIQIAVRIGTKDYFYKGDVKLEGGKYTIVNLIVGRDEITLGSVSINNWGEGVTIEGGEAQED